MGLILVGERMTFNIVIRIPKSELKRLGIDEDRYLAKVKRLCEKNIPDCEVELKKGIEASE